MGENRVLTFLQHVRARPEMYLGAHFRRPIVVVQAAVRGLLDGLRGRESATITVVVHEAASWRATIRDDGPGLPMAVYRGTPLATRIVSEPGTRVTDLAVANALSETFEVTTTSDGSTWRQRFDRGEPVSAFEQIDEVGAGTVVRLRPDATLLGSAELPVGLTEGRIEGVIGDAAGNVERWDGPAVAIVELIDERDGTSNIWRHPA